MANTVPTFNGAHSALLIILSQVPHFPPHYQRQLHFIMQIHALGAQHRPAIRRQDRGRRLQEEEWLLGAGVVELFDVVALGSLMYQ